MPYLYILECADGTYYTGSTWDLEKRLWEHRNGLGANHVRKRLPVQLVYCEECERVEDAYRREKQIQGWSRKKKQALIAGETNRLHDLAECRNESHYRNAPAGSASAGFDSAQPTEAEPAPASFDSTQPTEAEAPEQRPAAPLPFPERSRRERH